MKKICSFILGLCLFVATTSVWGQTSKESIAQHELILDSLYSPSIKAYKKYYVLAPNDYREQSYPILYMLHGAWGNYKNWIEKTQIANYASGQPILLIFPDADNSFYVNSPHTEEWQYADYILKDLLPHVEKQFQADTLQRGIAGLSMGGYGAFYLSTLAPDRFIFCGGLSSAFSVPGDGSVAWTEAELNGRAGKLLVPPFGKPDVKIHSGFYPPIIAQNLTKEPLPYFYFVHGIQDEYKDFLPAHRQIAETFSARNIAYEYHEVPGKHNWIFWDTHVTNVMQRFLDLCK